MVLDFEKIDLGGFGVEAALQDDTATTVKSNMGEAFKENPDAFAKNLQLSKASGVPEFAVKGDPVEVESRLKLDAIDFSTMSQRNPNTAKFLVDFNNAVIAQDDIDSLTGIENVLTPVADTVRALPAGFIQSFGSAFEGAGRTLDVGSRTLSRGLDAILPEAADPYLWITDDTPEALKALKILEPQAFLKWEGAGLKQAAVDIAAPADRQNIATDISSAVGSMGGQLMAYLMNPTASVGMLFSQGVDIQGEKQEATGTEGQSLQSDAAQLMGGVITGATEKMGLDAIVNRIPPNIKNAALRQIADVSLAGGIEAVQEVTESIAQNVLELYTTNPDAEIFEGLGREAIAAGAAGAIVRAVVNSLVPGKARALGESEAFAEQLSTIEQTKLDAINLNSENSKLRQRDAESFRQFVEQSDADQNTSVFMDSAQVALYLQTKRPDEIANDPALQALAKGAREASALGTDVVVPVADFATDIAGTPHYEQLRDHMTMSQETVTPFRQEQARAETESFMQRLIAEAETNISQYVEAQEIYNTVRDQLVDTGMVSGANAATMAQIVPAWAASFAKREGISVQEAYARSGLSIQGPQTGEAARLAAEGVLKQSFGTAESLFGDQGERITTDGGSIDIRHTGNEFAPRKQSIVDFVVDESKRGQGIGDALVKKALTKYDDIGGQASSAASTAVLYKNGFRNPTIPSGTLEDHLELLNEDSSIYMALKNDAGERFNQTPIDQTETEAFKKWFGDSKVVDADGKPLVVYHGTGGDFSEFNPGSHFGTQLQSLEILNRGERKNQTGNNIIPVYLNISNPKRVEDKIGVNWDVEIEEAKAEGYDGIVYQNWGEYDMDENGNPQDSYIAFNPEQIKSAIGNNGEFNPNDPSILKQEARGYYDPANVIIRLNESADLSTFLHEFAHFMYEMEMKAGTNTTESINNWFKRNADDVAKEANTHLGDDGALNQSSAQPKDLYVFHNLSEANLQYADELGGLAAPSLGVGRADVTTPSNFGEITLLGAPSLLEDPAARTFDADVYTPRQPKAEIQVSREKYKALIEAIATSDGFVDGLRLPDADLIRDNGVNELLRSDAMRAAFLDSKGVTVPRKKTKAEPLVKQAAKIEGTRWQLEENEKVKKLAEKFYRGEIEKVKAADPEMADEITDIYFYEDGELKNSYLSKFVYKATQYRTSGGVDLSALRDDIGKKFRNAKLESEFKKFAAEKLNEITEGKNLFKGFTNAGDRKYVAYTLANVVKEMTQKIQGGEDYFYGPGSIRSAYASELKTIEEVQSRRTDIVSNEDMTRVKQEADGKLTDALDALEKFYKFDASSFGYGEDAGRAIAEGPKGWSEAFRITPESKKIITDLVSYLKNLPTEYFENKMQRAVGLQEFKAAIVPNNVSEETLALLKKHGITDVRKYKSGDDADRNTKIKKSKDLLFQTDTPNGEQGPITADDVINYIDNKTTGDAAKDSAIRTAMHEQFARGFETYLMEGKAPSIELRNAFRTFARWLVQIYQSIKGDLRVRLDDEVRQVFDRLLATEEQIIAAESRLRYEPMFTDAVMAGMTEQQFIDYKKRQEKVKDKQSETLRDKIMKQLKRQTEQWWNDEKQDLIREEVAKLNEQPVYAARNRLLNGDIKLDHATVKELVGRTFTNARGTEVTTIPTELRNMTAKGQAGIHPDEAAALLGYRSGSELIHDLMTAPKVMDAAALNAEQTMLDIHGDILNDGTIEQQADEAVMNEERGKLFLDELKALSKGTNAPTFDHATVKAIAQERIARLSFRENHPAKYRNAEIRAAQESAAMLAKGNREGAATAKARQVLNYYLAMASTEARNETDKIVTRMARYNKKQVREEIQKADGGYWDQIVKILQRFEFRKSATLSQVAQQNQDINTWAKERIEADGDGLVLSPVVMNESYVTHWKNVPFGDLQGINDSVKNIEHVARYANKITRMGEEVDFNQLVDRWVSSMNEKATDKFTPKRTDVVEGRNWGRWAMAQMTKIPYMASWMDGGERTGISHQILVQPFTDAYAAEMALWKHAGKPVMDAIEGRSKADIKRQNQKIFIPEINDNLFGHQIIAVALNTGNAGNLRKLLLGEGWANPDNDAEINFNNPKLQAVLKHMTKSDWDLVQLIWDQMEVLYPQLAEVHKRTTGLVPPKVEAVPVVTPFGELRGGYYPVKYDPSRSHQAEQNEDKRNAQIESMFSNTASIQASVNAGATNERTGYYAPIRLSLDVVPAHFQESIHYITHHDPVREVNRLLRNKSVADTIKAKLGPEEFAQLKPWLNDIAKDGQEAPTKIYWDAMLQRLRFGVTLGTMGFKASTGIIQISGLSNTIAEVGIAPVMQATRGILNSKTNMVSAWEFAKANSKVLENRAVSMDREIKNAMNKLSTTANIKTGNKVKDTLNAIDSNPLLKAAQEVSMKHIALIQTYMVDLPSWHAAYIKGMSDWGDEQRAFQYADWVIEQVQGSGATKDLARIMRGQSETGRMLTMFMTFFSSLWNLERDIVKGAKSGKYSTTNVAAKAMFLFTIPVLFEMMMKGELGGGDEDDEESTLQKMLTKVAMYPMASVPFMRDIANGLLGEYGYNISPLASIMEQGISTIPKVVVNGFTDEEITGSQAKGATKFLGATFGVPGTSQAWATGEHIYQVIEEGEELSLHSLLFGPEKK